MAFFAHKITMLALTRPFLSKETFSFHNGLPICKFSAMLNSTHKQRWSDTQLGVVAVLEMCLKKILTYIRSSQEACSFL